MKKTQRFLTCLCAVLLCMSIILPTVSLAEVLSMPQEKFDFSASGWVTAGKGFTADKNGVRYRNTVLQSKLRSGIYKEDAVFANGHISFDLIAEDTKELGFVFRKTDDSNYYVLRFDYSENKIRLLRKINTGVENLVKTVSFSLDNNKIYNVDVALLGKDFVITINKEKVLTYTDELLPEGYFGFTASKGKADIENIRIYESPEDEYISYADEEEHTKIYVSPEGSDISGNGTYEKPYLTIEHARKNIKKALPALKPIDIVLKEGNYRIKDTVIFDAQHSGSAFMPVTYKAEEGKEVVINGSTVLNTSAFEVVTDEKILSRLYEEVRGKVYQLDLAKQGIKRENIDWVSGYNEPGEMGQVARTVQLFVNDRPQILAKWPNDSYAVIGECIRGSTSASDPTGGQITFTNSEPLRWVNAKDMFVGGRMFYEWYEEWIPVKNVDTENMKINLALNSQYGLRTDHEWTAYNLLEEIDIPGEWYIDIDNMMLYIYPDREYTKEDIIELSTFNGSMFSVRGAKYINFEGITFAKSAGMLKKIPNTKHYDEGNAIEFGDDTRNMNIKNCKFRDVGGYGVVNMMYINASTPTPWLSNINVKIDGCDFIRCRENGTYTTGGNRITMEQSGISVSNCFYYGTGAYVNRYQSGNGNSFINNLVSHTSTTGIRGTGSEVIIKNNEVSFSTYEQSDMGAIYFGRNLAEDGSQIVNNYVHDYGIDTEGKDFSTGAVYLDDVAGGILVKNNIFKARSKDPVSTAIIYGGGPDVVIEGNISIGARKGYIIQNRVGSYPNYLVDKDYALDNAKVALNSKAYITKYPKAARHLALIDGDYKVYDSQTTYINNVSYDCVEADSKTNFALEPAPTGNIGDAIVLEGDIFVNPDNHDFRIKDSVMAEKNLPDVLPHENFDMDAIGPQREIEMRKDLIEFNITTPRQGEVTKFTNYVTIGWQISDMADEYYYDIATDENFENIVFSGKTYFNGVTARELQPNTKYYLRVRAKSYMRKYGYDSYNANGAISFTTSADKYIVTDLLDAKIAILENQHLATMEEGNKAGQYVPGTKKRIEGEIAEAKAVRYTTQENIDNHTAILQETISTLDANKNIGYGTFKFNKDVKWNVVGDVTTETVEDTTKLTVNAQSTVSFDQILSNDEVLCFKFKVSDWTESYMTFGLRYQDPAMMHYSDNSNYILFKKDAVEVQKKGKLFETFANENFIENDVWHETKIGCITTTKGVNFIFEIDGKVVCDYLDTSTDAQYNAGRFAMLLPKGITMEIAKSENVPNGLYQLSEKTKDLVEHGEKIVFDTSSDGFLIINGNWTETGNTPEGHREISANETGAACQITMVGEGTMTYRVYYYHNPSPENDNNVKVVLTGKDGEYVTYIDMTKGEKGYVDLGTFKFVSDNAAIGRTMIQFIGSGNGKVPVSSVEMRMVDKNKYPDLLTQKAGAQ